MDHLFGNRKLSGEAILLMVFSGGHVDFVDVVGVVI